MLRLHRHQMSNLRSGPRPTDRRRGRERISTLAAQVTEDLVPRALLILNMTQNSILVKEAIKLRIPVVAVLDNKSDPFGIQFPIPGN